MSKLKCIHGCGKSKKPGAAFCTKCGAALPGVVAKARRPYVPPIGPFLDPNSSDPAERELLQNMIYKAAMNLPFIGKGR